MIRLLSIAYGEQHSKLFMDSCMRSLMAPKNKQALEEAEGHWHIYTDEKNLKVMDDFILKNFKNIKPVIKDISDTRRYIDSSQSAFVAVAEECLNDGSKMLFAPPDIYFGDGSVNGLAKAIADKNSDAPVAVVAHVRVRPEFIEEANGLEHQTNAKLVTLAWKHLHRCWEDAELGHPRQNQWGTGVSWRRIDENLYGITHRLPTPYLLSLTPEDLNYFKLQGGFGHYDHQWPGDILMHRGRIRYVTSSDVAFMVEITEPHKNISNVVPGGTPNPNDFWKHNPHNEMFKQILVTLRGE